MTISELIAKLQEIRRIHGDIPVFRPSEEIYNYETNEEDFQDESEITSDSVYEALGKCYIT